MKTTCTLLVALVAVGCHKKDREVLSPLEFIELCAPGGSSDKCSREKDFTHDTFPAGRLDALFHSQDDADVGPGHPSRFATNGIFVYELQFHAAASDVFWWLKTELGEPTKTLPSWIPPTLLAGDAYWVTPDGLWEFNDHRVVWYSHPFHSNGFNDTEQGRLDRYVYPAPYAASIWRQIGKLLIGSDLEPSKLRKQ